MENVQGPGTLKECFSCIEEHFSEDEITKLKNLKEDDLIHTHFGLGLWIRNNWLHPKESPLMKTFSNYGWHVEPDAMSALLIKATWLYLNNIEINVKKFRELMDEMYFFHPYRNDEEKLDQSIAILLG